MIRRLGAVLAAVVCLIGTTVLLVDEALGARGGGRANVSRSGPAAGGSFRHGGSSNARSQRHDVRGNGRDQRREVGSQRREVGHDRVDTRREAKYNVYDDRKETRERYEDRYRARRAVSISSRAFRSKSCTTTVVNGATFHQCGSTWYQPAYQGGQTVYVVTSAP